MLFLLYCTLGILAGYGQIVFSKATAYDQRQTGDVNVQIHLKDVQVIALVNTDLMDDYTDYDYAYDYADFTLKPILKPTTTTTTTTEANALSASTSAPNTSTTSPPNTPTSAIKPWTTWPTNTPSSSSSSTDNSSNDLTVDTSKSNSSEAQSSTTPTNAQESTIVTTTRRGSTIETNDDSTKGKNETSMKLPTNDQAGDRVIIDEQDLVKIDEEKKNITTTSEPALKNNKVCAFPYVANNKGRCRSLNNRRRVSLVPLTMRLGSRLTKKGHLSLRKDLPIRIFKYDTSQ